MSNVMTMEAGPEMDALVAEALGYRLLTGAEIPENTPDGENRLRHRQDEEYPQRVWLRGSDYFCSYCGNMPSYSTDPAAALAVWQHLRESGDWCCLTIKSDHDYCWRLELTRGDNDHMASGGAHHDPEIVVDGEDSLPLAICKAALLAKEEQP